MDAKAPFKIVRNMCLICFDAPCLHKICADKPKQDNGMMSARVTRYVSGQTR